MVITRYNETNADHRAVALTNSIGAISPTLVGVGFSHPSGKFRVNDFTNFTHFTAEFGGVTYIYKVTSFTAVNSTVREVAYTLDYMKDWFSKNAWSNLKGAVVVKSNNTTDRSPFIVDHEFLADGTNTVGGTTIGSFTRLTARFVVVVKFPYNSELNETPAVACGMTAANFKRFCEEMLKTEGAAMAKQIQAIYYCPFWGDIPATNKQSGNLKYMKVVTEKTQGAVLWWEYTTATQGLDDFGGGIPCEYIYKGDTIANPLVSATVMQYTFNINDFIDVDLSSYRLYLPYYGSVEVPVRDLTDFTNKTVNISVEYMLNPFEGKISYRWTANGNYSIFSETVALPVIAVPSGELSLQIENTNERFTSQQVFTGIKGATDIVSFKFGEVMSDSLAMASNEVNTQNSINAMARAGNGYINSVNGWDGFVDRSFKLWYSKPNSVTYATRCAHAGYPCNKMAVNVTPATNKRYLIDTKYMEVNGLDWYANGVRADISGEYIYYNR